MSEFWKLSLLSMFVLLLAACTDDAGVEPSEETADDAGEGAGTEGVTIATSSDMVSLDPTAAMIHHRN